MQPPRSHRLHLGFGFLTRPYDFGPAKHLSELGILLPCLRALPPAGSGCNAWPARTRKDGHVLRLFYRADLMQVQVPGGQLASLPCVVSAGSAGGLTRGQLVVRRSLDRGTRNRPSVNSVSVLEKSHELTQSGEVIS